MTQRSRSANLRGRIFSRLPHFTAHERISTARPSARGCQDQHRGGRNGAQQPGGLARDPPVFNPGTRFPRCPGQPLRPRPALVPPSASGAASASGGRQPRRSR
jgi:hypothetical protein